MTMTVMCRLVRGKTHHGGAKVLSNFLHQRTKSDCFDSVMSVTARPATSRSVNAAQTQPVEVVAAEGPRWETYQPYHEMMQLRRGEAKRSILVEIERLNDSRGLKRFCENYGPIKKYYMYTSSGKNFVLVEFKNRNTRFVILDSAYHSKDLQSIPVTSQCLYFRYRSGGKSEPALQDSTKDIQCDEENMLLQMQNLNCHSSDRLKTEIHHIHQSSQISDLSIRLRFFTCNLLETALNGLFSKVRALPFGSSVSGFGRNTGDLDIYLQFRRNISEKAVDKSELFFHAKSSPKDKNLQLKVIGDLISIMLPGCSGVMSILSARVPIIKYRQSMSNLECDLQNSSVSGVDLSHIQWMMNHWDVRVAPLVYALRIWAAHNNVVSARKPGPFITNFSLVMMIIFFLQTEKILPHLQLLKKISNDSWTPSLDPNSDFIFPDLRKISDGSWKVRNESDLGVDTLLLLFFKFYSTFNFEEDKISIIHGTIMPKTLRDHLEIENPVNPVLNIARNVTRDALQVFRRATREAYINLTQESYKTHSIKKILRNNGMDIIANERLLNEKAKRKKKGR